MPTGEDALRLWDNLRELPKNSFCLALRRAGSSASISRATRRAGRREKLIKPHRASTKLHHGCQVVHWWPFAQPDGGWQYEGGCPRRLLQTMCCTTRSRTSKSAEVRGTSNSIRSVMNSDALPTCSNRIGLLPAF